MKNNHKANKTFKFHCVVLFVLITQSMSVWAGELKVREKTVVNAPSAAVWALVGGFKTLERWHPDIARSMSIGTGEEPGDIRILELNNNDTIVERLDSYDDNSMVLQYRILESPLPIKNYKASITVVNLDKHMTEVIWQSSFIAVDISDNEIKEIISGIYMAGLNSLDKIFE